MCEVTLKYEDIEIVAEFWPSHEDDCQIEGYECFIGDKPIEIDDATRAKVEAILEEYACHHAHDLWVDKMVSDAEHWRDVLEDR